MKKFIVISFIIASILITVFLIYNKNNHIHQVDGTKYDLDKKITEIDITNIDEYREYLKDISKTIQPAQLIKYIDYKRYYYYVDDNEFNNRFPLTGNELINILKKEAYENLFKILIKKEQDWTELPLTDNFKKKFSEKKGITGIDVKHITIKDFNDPANVTTQEYEYPLYLKDFSLDKKTFSVEHVWIADDAYEKYSDYNIYYMFNDGAGAYNSDVYNYEFILDDEGYLDDIKLLNVKHIIIEGTPQE